MSTSNGEQVVGFDKPSSQQKQMIGVNEVTPMEKPKRQEQSTPTSSQAADLRARLRSQEDEIDALMELWATVLPIEWLPGHRQFPIWLRRYGFPLVEKGITVAAGKLHQVTEEAKRPWTADDAIRYASGVTERTQEKEREQQRQVANAQERLAATGADSSQTSDKEKVA
jgi:hypothetical protein